MSPEVLPRLEALLARYHLPTATDYAAADLYEKTLSDKKRAGDTLSLVVPTAWGRVCSTPSPWASCCPGSKGAGAMTVTLLPGPAQGRWPPSSKSAAHRSLICAALGTAGPGGLPPDIPRY